MTKLVIFRKYNFLNTESIFEIVLTYYRISYVKIN